jgi:hypothetical protein
MITVSLGHAHGRAGPPNLAPPARHLIRIDRPPKALIPLMVSWSRNVGSVSAFPERIRGFEFNARRRTGKEEPEFRRGQARCVMGRTFVGAQVG